MEYTSVSSEELIQVMRKAHNSQGRDRDDLEETPRSMLYENVPTVHLGARSDMTEFSNDGFGVAPSEITDVSNITSTSQTPLALHRAQSRPDLCEIARNPSRRMRTPLSLNTGFVKPSHGLKERWKVSWELLKLNYRMLISLTLTSFVAAFVS